MSSNTGGLVLGIVGAVVGTYVGVGPAVGWAIGSAVGSLAFPPKMPGVEGPRLNDLKTQTATYGVTIPIVFGAQRLAPTIIWSADNTEVITEESSGKGSPSQSSTTYSYFGYFAGLLCDCKDGPIVGVRRIWNTFTGELIYDISSTSGESGQAASGSIAEGITVYTGTSTQLADPTIESYLGVGNVPAYRYRAYVVFSGMALEKFQNQIPHLEFEVVAAGSLETYRAVTEVSSAYTTTNWLVGQPAPAYVRIKDGVITFNVYYTPGGESTTFRFDYDLNAINKSVVPLGAERVNNLLGFLGGDSITGLPVVYDLTTYSPARVLIVGTTALASRTYAVQPDGSFMGACISADATRLYVLTVVASNTIMTVYDESLSIVGSGIVTSVIPVSTSAGGIGGEIMPGFGGKTIAVESDHTHLWYGFAGTTAKVCSINSDYTLTLLGTITDTGSGAADVWTAADKGTHVAVQAGQLVTSNALHIMSRNTIMEVDTVLLSDIVETLSTRTNSDTELTLSASDINVTSLTDEVTGYTFSRQGPIRSALEQLAQAFYFDTTESDGKIKFVKRGGAIAATISNDYLAAHEYGSDDPDLVSISRQQEVEIPMSVTVKYTNPSDSYQIASQQSRRLNFYSGSPLVVELPISMTAEKAKSIVDVLRFDAASARNTYSFATTRKYAYLEPTDPITVDGVAVRLISKEESTSGIINWTAAAEDSRAYTKVFTAAPTTVTDQSLTLVGPSKLVVMNLPILRDVDDGACAYVVAAGYLNGWRGAAISRSSDGVTFNQVAATATAGVIGYATTVLGDFSSQNIFDESSTLTVRLESGTLTSATELDVLNGANAFALYSSAGFEVGQFKTPTLNVDGTFTITGFLRGRKGTEFAMAHHAVGDTFVLLNGATYRAGEGISDIDVVRYWKATSFGLSPDGADVQPFTDDGASIMPLSPVLIGGGRNASLDVVATWVRRTRVGQEWRDFNDVASGETSEAYEVEIWDATYTTLKRTITGLTSPTTTYTVAQQTTDFGSAQSTVYVSVYQISADIGRGYEARGTI